MPDRKRTQTNQQDQKRTRDEEHPQRPEPGTMEGPGGRHESKADQEARDKTTRRGER
jgi:hypothetical protein